MDGSGNLYITGAFNPIRKVDASTGNISTVAGTGHGGFSGDGGAATAARLNIPQGVAVDGSSNLYISDTSNNRIRKVDASTGNISTVAGSGATGFGLGGFSGDGGAATSATLNVPDDVAVDGSGNLYIVDRLNNRIRKVDASTGNISTVAGSGATGFGLGGFSGDGGAATSATLQSPNGVALDNSGNLYIADSGNNRIRKVDASTGNISTVAGSGATGFGSGGFSGDGGAATSATLNVPDDVAVDGSGNLYIADTRNDRIRKVDASTGNISTVAGSGTRGFGGDGGAATSATLNWPRGVAVDGSGNLYIADTRNGRIRKVDASTGNISTVAGTATISGDGGAATAARLFGPRGVALDGSGNLYIADTGNNRIRKVDATTGNISTIAGSGATGFSGDGGAATAARLFGPRGVALDGSGNLYIADTFNNRIRKVDASTGDISTVAGSGAPGFGISGDGGAATAARLVRPAGVAVDGVGNLYIADGWNNSIRKVEASTGDISTVAGTGTSGFSGDGGAATAAKLGRPAGVAVDGVGNLYIADAYNDRIRKVDASTGNISTVAGSGTSGFSGDSCAAASAQLYFPAGVAVDGVGNLYIADTFNNRIRKVDASTGNISTVAGSGATGFGSGSFSGDGGAATSATLVPNDVAVDSAGNLYIAASGSHRIRRTRTVPRPPDDPLPATPLPCEPPPSEPPPNEPPVAVKAFEDAALDPGERLEVSLSGRFRDPEGGELTYSADSSNSDVADAGVTDDGQVWVEGRSPGVARVLVTATDAGGLRTFQAFIVRVGTVVSFAADTSAPEGGTLRLRLVSSQPAPEDLSVAYALVAAGDEASAADDSDHDGGSGGMATITAGETEAEIEIAILDDAQVEPPREFFALVLKPPPADAGYVLGLKTRAQATIEEGVCDRAAPVRDALRGRGDCAAVEDLSSLLVLNLAGRGVEALRPEDFLGLSGLQVLDLSRNRLSAWPGAVLGGLPHLTSLRLSGNRLRELPAGALAAHPRLIGLYLAGNELTGLPPGAFRELADLRRLDLSGNALAELPGDAIAGLSRLWALRLHGNLLAELPAGLFEGVSSLRELQLQDNPGSPFVLTLELARTDAEPWAPGPASVAMRVAQGAPFALRSLLTASGEALPEGVALSVPAGAIASEPVTVPQGEAQLVLAQLDGAPPVLDDECELGDGSRLPCFQGIATAAGPPLALFKRAPVPAPIESQALRVGGDALRLDLASQFETALGEALTYAAESSDPSVVRIRIKNGMLIAEAVGEGVATLTVTATDSDGLSATLRFTVQADRTARSRWRSWRLILLEPEGDGARPVAGAGRIPHPTPIED